MSQRTQTKLDLRLLFTILFITQAIAKKEGRANTKTEDDDQNFNFNEFSNSIDKKTDKDFYRLPKAIVPKNYKLELRPNLTEKTFEGKVKISLQVLEPTNKITLHFNKLNYTAINFQREKQCIKILSVNTTSDKRELLIIYLEREIPVGNYATMIKYNGRLDNSLVGLYASRLKTNRTMVSSKFQPTYARQAFPCFDEPDFKATYDISLVKPKSYIALSNMNEISKTLDPATNLETVSFATSVPMSTYLACFVICEFDYKEVEVNAMRIGKNFKLRSYAQRGETHKIDFAQDIGKRATEFYIQYYEVPFPLPKLDMIAIPDYVSGATEHWGLITYRETQFLIDEATASPKNKLAVANTIAHELAHMWFGNLVTMKWWDEVWLNEGFASYMQFKALNALEPSWTMLDQFLTKTLHAVLVIDAKLSSHPIVQTVNTPDQITAIFDSISYSKGSSVLRMLEGFIGEENFRKGVSDYLKKHKFGNTVTTDLLMSLAPYFKVDHQGLCLSHIMDTWTRQMGYPVLQVKASNAPNTYVITQRRFLLDPEAVIPDDSEYHYKWFVPITYKTNKGSSNNILWFPDNQEDVKLTLTGEDSWLKINNNQVGYYRVNYETDMWNKLIEQLKSNSNQLTISDRAHLVDDAFALASASVIPYDLALNLSTYLTVERDYVPWQTSYLVFRDLSARMINSSAHSLLKKYVQRLISPLYKDFSWDSRPTGVTDGLLRSVILALALRFDLPDARTKARNMFLSWLNSHGTSEPVAIENDLRDIIYFYGMKGASQEEWNKLWEIYLKEGDVQEKTNLRHALTAPTDVKILQGFMTLAWDETKVRSQDYLNVLSLINANPLGTQLVWNDVRNRWTELVGRFTLNSRYLGGLIPTITDSFDSDEKLKEMESFFAKYPDAGAGETARKRALETVKNNIKWANTYQKTIAAWLQAQQ